MAKARDRYVCTECGSIQSRWMGKCPDCGAWDVLQEQSAPIPAARPEPAWAVEGAASPVGAAPLAEVSAPATARLPTGIGEFDRVLGGGFVPGSAVLLGGDPGIGKSTLLMQAAFALARAGSRVLYVTSEESAFQTRLRAERLLGGAVEALPELFYVLADTSLDRAVAEAHRLRPDVVVLDSIQMIQGPEGAPGSIVQIRQCGAALVQLAKSTGLAVILVGHITKDGHLAGPKLLEHLVDVVLTFEGDRDHAHRFVRSLKNRFGTTLEVGLFEMTGRGLAEVREIDRGLDPAADPVPGSVICPVLHGSRALLVEIQALTASGFLGAAKRRTSGLDTNRLAMLIAVLEQHGGLRLGDQDVFTSVVGGLRIVEPAADLALALTIAGAFLRRAMPAGTAVVGEVGLGGEIRGVARLEARMRAAARLGFRRLVIPRDAPPVTGIDIEIERVRTVAESLALLDAGGAPTVQVTPRKRAKTGR
jgi:DNA repair protein RadA/Sms